MIAAPILLQAAASPDITVATNKLRRLQLSLAMDEGSLKSCTVKVSSGDQLIDNLACASARSCIDRGIADSNALMDCIDHDITTAVGRRNNGKESDDAQD